MPFIEWNDRLSVSVPSIDRQHKTLIKYINKLEGALAGGKIAETLPFVLTGLKSYTQVHFIYEEMLFEKYHYPEEADHKVSHGKLFVKVADFQSRFEQGDTIFGPELLDFLKNWLNNHILKEDMSYSEFLLEQGVK